jgi:hypothetical protein
MIEEIRLHKLYDVKNNDNYYNQCNSTSTKFFPSREAFDRAAESRRGRTAETHEYIRKQIESRKKYIGEGRTEAQKATQKHVTPAQIYADKFKRSRRGADRTEAEILGRISASEKVRGTKCPAKGRPGASSTLFKPWYYIDSNGNKFEIYDTTKQDYAHKLGISARQLGHRFHYTNEHKPMYSKNMEKSPIYGFTFGNIINT